MKIKCENCHSSFTIRDPERLKKSGTRVRCSKCSHVFTIYPPVSRGADAEKSDAPAKTDGNDKNIIEKNKKQPDFSPVFRVIGDHNCPLHYVTGDEFKFSGKTLELPREKSACLILIKDIMKMLNKFSSIEKYHREEIPGAVFNCSGCTGVIRLEFRKMKKQETIPEAKKEDGYVGVVAGLLKNFPIFQSVEEHNVEEFSSLLKLEQYVKGDTIIKKGDPGRSLYIISTGQVEVLGDGDMSIAFLSKGEVFGEMSLLSGNPVGATVKAVEPSSVLYISSKDFRRILDKSPSLQMYFTRLLARRMAEINLARSEEFSSGMTGKLSEMPPSELFQTFNMNQKTGILSMTQSQKSASLTFREGELIDARYGEYEGEEAFFELLKLKEGRFKFKPGLPPEMLEAPEIGDFMAILMEGLRRIDEADRKFLKTLIPNLSMNDIPTAETENSK